MPLKSLRLPCIFCSFASDLEMRLFSYAAENEGIVLHTLKYNDTSIIVDMYTELSGRASFLVTVPRSRKAAVKSVLFQPLSFY